MNSHIVYGITDNHKALSQKLNYCYSNLFSESNHDRPRRSNYDNLES